LTLTDWLDRISCQHPKAIDLGLERVVAVAAAMGFQRSPDGIQLPAVTVLVGGTNGKGSTCALIESIALQSGFRVATYTSPHLIQFNERLRLNGEMVSDAALIESFERVEHARAAAQQSLTYFEFTTLAVLDCIRQTPVDLAVLEIGLGGRLDAVNVVDPDCSILVSVDLDHQQFLGDTREKIGWEKAHIARANKPFICADPEPPQSVLDYVSEIGADLWRFGVDYNFQGDRQQWSWAGRGQRRNAMAYPALRGANQLLNASAALACFASLRDKLPVTQGAVRQGLALVDLAGRFQVLPGQPAVVLDVAHNPHAASVLAVNLDQMGFFPNTIAVTGMLADKDAAEIVRRMGDRVDHWLTVSLVGPDAHGRERDAQSLAAIIRELHPSATIECFETPEAGYERARELAEANDRIVVFGSFLTVASIMPLRHAR
jgi:dihydrofolate synthase/folylpolyglutamate synthase